MASGSGVQNKRPMKKNNKKKWLQKVLDYLKSDSYMFAPLIFHPTNSAAAPGFHLYMHFLPPLFSCLVGFRKINRMLLWVRGGNDKTHQGRQQDTAREGGGVSEI